MSSPELAVNHERAVERIVSAMQTSVQTIEGRQRMYLHAVQQVPGLAVHLNSAMVSAGFQKAIPPGFQTTAQQDVPAQATS